MTKMTLFELKHLIIERLSGQNPRKINIWDHEFHYNPEIHTVDALTRAALDYFHQEKSFLGVTTPADKRFMKKLMTRLHFLGVPEKIIEKIVFKVRVAGATNKT